MSLSHTGPPPAGGSKTIATPATIVPTPSKKIDVGILPPPPTSTISPPATASVPAVVKPVTSTPLATPVQAKPFIATPQTAPAAATPAAITSTHPALPSPPSQTTAQPPPPSSAGLKSTIYPQSNVVTGVQRGVFGDVYGAKNLSTQSPARAPVSSSPVSPVVSEPSLPPPPPPSVDSDSVPPPPPPPSDVQQPRADDVSPPPPPPPQQTPLQEELASALKGGLNLRPVEQTQKAHPPLPAPPAAAAPAVTRAPPVSAPAPVASKPAPAPAPAPPAPAPAPAAVPSSNPFANLLSSISAAPSAPPPPAQLCSGCSKPIVGGVLEVGDGRTFHPECYACTRCRQAITDDILEVGSKPYHRACLSCNTCGTPLANQPFAVHPTNGAIFCANHARAGLAGESTPTPQSHAPAPPSPAAAPSVDACRGCGASTKNSSESLISAGEGRTFHARCLRCASCATQLSPTGKVFQHEGEFICESCQLAKFAQACVRCKQPIQDQAMSVDVGGGKKLSYHTVCFNCAGCQKSLHGIDFYLGSAGALVCEACA